MGRAPRADVGAGSTTRFAVAMQGMMLFQAGGF